MSKLLQTASDSLSADNYEAIILYGSAPSPCARRVRITLLEKQLAFDEVEIDLVNMEQRSPAYLALNPNGFVPTLAHGELTIYESAAIIDYLEEQFPQTSLIPSNPWAKAQVRMWQAAEGTMAKLFRPLMYQRLMGPVQHLGRTHDEAMALARRSTDDPQDLLWEARVWEMKVLTAEQQASQQQKLYDWLAIVEQALQGRHFMVGDHFSQADIALFPRIQMYPAIGLPLLPAQYPNVCGWIERLQNRPSFVDSEPAQAKKLRKLASGPLFQKIRHGLTTPSQQRSLTQRGLLWGSGKLFRKISRTEELLSQTVKQRELPVPGEFKPTPRTNEASRERFDLPALELFGDYRSPPSARIALLLNHLGLAFQWRPVDLAAGEQKAETYRVINPLAEVPALRHQVDSEEHSETRTLYDSLAIAEYVASAAGCYASWFGDNSEQAARNRMWLALESGSHKEFKPMWQKYVLKKTNEQGFIGNETTALNRIKQQLGMLEQVLSEQAWLCGSAVRFADLAWYTRIESLNAVQGFKLADFPNIRRWHQRARDYFDQQEAIA